MVALFPTLAADSPHSSPAVLWGCSVLSCAFPCCLMWKWFLLLLFTLPVFSLFLLSLQISYKEKYQMNYVCLFFYPSSLSACSVSDHINLTVSLLNFLLSSWLLIIQAIYKSFQALCTEVYLLFSTASVKSLCRGADHHSPCLLAFSFLLHCPSCSKCSCLKCSTCCLDQIALNVWWLTNCTVSLSSYCFLLLPLLSGLLLAPAFPPSPNSPSW